MRDAGESAISLMIACPPRRCMPFVSCACDRLETRSVSSQAKPARPSKERTPCLQARISLTSTHSRLPLAHFSSSRPSQSRTFSSCQPLAHALHLNSILASVEPCDCCSFPPHSLRCPFKMPRSAGLTLKSQSKAKLTRDRRNLATTNTPLPPSIEKAYHQKCIDLKRRLKEMEIANDEARLRKRRLDRSITKMRLERAFLLERLAKIQTAPDDSDDAESPPNSVSHVVPQPHLVHITARLKHSSPESP